MTDILNTQQKKHPEIDTSDILLKNERHIPVLLNEIINVLDLKPGAVVVDCNLGDGGHSEVIIKSMNGNVNVFGFDLDSDAISRTRNYLTTSLSKNEECAKKLLTSLIPVQANFSALDTELAKRGFGVHSIDAVFFDLGLSTYDLIGSGKGFTFREDEPLKMTFGTPADYLFDASDIVNTWAEEDIANVIYAYGEDVLARKIAKMIVEARAVAPIVQSKQLAQIIEAKLGRGGLRFTKQGPKKITHPATKTFQALRIAVNNELEHLRIALEKAFAVLKPGGKLAIISYHSLEDRIVKQYFKQWSRDGIAIEITKKPMVPSEKEQKENPRSRSAKLRIIIKK